VARLAIQVHGVTSPGTLQLVERESDRFINPMRGFTIRGVVNEPSLSGGVELRGTALSATTVKESEDGRAIVLRCVNLSEREQTGSWTLPVPVESAYYGRLDETTGQRIDPSEHEGRSTVEFIAGPRAVVTILITPRR
jgi:hypothetical protein